MFLTRFFVKSLKKLHSRNKGKLSDKWEIFFKIYDREFQSLRHQSIKMLEIGIQNGGSLETWSKYFRNAKLIVGCDINPKCGALTYASPRIKVIVGDATTPETAARIDQLSPEYDLIIDDGSHVSKDIVNAFLHYFPRLKPGGIFCVEDTHTLYWSNFGGGLRNTENAKEFFKDLTDVINHEHWRDEPSIKEYLSNRLGAGDVGFIEEGWVESVSFYNSMIVIRKAERAGHDKLGKRMISGEVAAVDDEPAILRGR